MLPLRAEPETETRDCGMLPLRAEPETETEIVGCSLGEQSPRLRRWRFGRRQSCGWSGSATGGVHGAASARVQTAAACRGHCGGEAKALDPITHHSPKAQGSGLIRTDTR